MRTYLYLFTPHLHPMYVLTSISYLFTYNVFYAADASAIFSYKIPTPNQLSDRNFTLNYFFYVGRRKLHPPPPPYACPFISKYLCIV